MAAEILTSVRSQSGAGSVSANLHANEGEVELSASDLCIGSRCMQEAACESSLKAASGLVQDGLTADRLHHGCSADGSKSKRHLVPW